ncbi:carbohydrate-binding protein [Kutzneria sp. NPDC051319]|uniref:carbohydrate-binding protein n=1 Tax=Kutzneria sp. NPDC051319 TaxID=3155047 RepID=UPI00343FB604
MTPSRSGLVSLVAATLLLGGATAVAAPAQHGRTFYVSTTGADSNVGSSAKPFQHIQQCATVLTAGDTCVVAAGTYRQTVTPANNGTANAPITYTAAPGATVTVDGTDPVTGWTQVTPADLATLAATDGHLPGSPFASGVNAGHIYRAPVTLNPKLPSNQVFVDGALSAQAALVYPGNNPMRPTMGTAQGGTSNSISDSALTQPDGYWIGARLTARNWFITETETVTASSPGSVTAAGWHGCVGLAPNGVETYSLSGRLELLGHSGEWFYSNGSLYLWTLDGDSPAGHAVEAKQRNLGFDLSGKSYTTLKNLGARGTTVQTSATSTHDVIDGLTGRYLSAYDDIAPDPNMVENPDDCAFLTAGESTSGVMLMGTDNTVRNSMIDWSAGNGVVVGGSHNTVTGNTILHTDYMGSYAAGINITGPHETVTHNTVASVGRTPVNIDDKMTTQTVPGETVSYNDLSDWNNLVNDGGAIYVCCHNNLATTVFDHNLLHDPAITPNNNLTPGIYLDNGAYNATVLNNVAWNNNYGVVLFNGDSSSGDKVYNNTEGTDPKVVSLFGSTYSTSEFANNIGDVDAHAGITESNNIPYSTDPLFTNASAHDYSLQAGSPARNAGVVRPPATDGYRDRKPSAGAYQYGAPKWSAGAGGDRTTVQAERYANNSGVSRHSAGTGVVLGGFDGGDWAQYTAVDFGQGRTWFHGSVGEDPNYAGRQFQIRLDSLTGPVLGTVTVMNTGGFDTYTDQSVPIVATAGKHDVYLVALGSSPGVANLDFFTFS